MNDSDWRALIKGDPEDRSTRLAYADWLEERGDLIGAFKQREEAGLGRLYFAVRNKNTGTLSDVYRTRGHLLRRLQDYASPHHKTTDERHWPVWFLGGPDVGDTEVVYLWQPNPVVIGANGCVDLPALVKTRRGKHYHF